MGGGGVRSKETGQLAGRMRGTKGDGHNERHRQMGGCGVRRGNVITSWTTRGLEGQDEWPEPSVDTADGSLRVRYGAAAPQRQWTAQRLLDGKGWRDGSSTVRDGATATRRQGTAQRLLDSKGRRERSGDGLRAQRRSEAMDSSMANGQ